MGHALKVIQFDSDENGTVEQNNTNSGSNLDKTLQTLKFVAILTAILGVISLVLEVKYYFQFRFEIYLARLIPTLFSFITLLFIQTKFGRKHRNLLTHLYLVTILGSVSYVTSKIPSLFLYNSIAATLFILTLSLFFVWEVKNQILVSVYFLVIFGISALFSNVLDFSQVSTFVTILTVTVVMVISIISSNLRLKFYNAIPTRSNGQSKKSNGQYQNSEDTSFTEILDTSTVPFFQISIEGEIQYSNLSFNQIIGIKNSSDLGELNFFNDCVKNNNVKNHLIKKLENKGRLENYRLNILNREGKNVVLLMDCKMVFEDEDSSYLEGSIRDITTQYERERVIANELETLRKSRKNQFNIVDNATENISHKKNFISNMGHELRTPMNSVLGFLTLIENGLFESEEELKEFSHNAKLSAESLLNLLNDLVEISKIEDGTITIVDYEFNLRDEIEKTTSVIIPHAKEKKINLSCDISENIPSTIISDPSKYVQILTNLLNNAIEATEAGEIKVFISEEVEKNGIIQLVTSVEDNGLGIPFEKINQVFDGTVETRDSDSKASTSILHLMICKELTTLLNGSMSFEVKPEVGSKFVYKIPVSYSVKDLDDKPTLELDNNESNASFARLKPRLLLVEDNPISRKVEKKLLEQAGYIVDCVENGFDAIESVEGGKYDLVLMDIELKGMDGLETTKKIRELSDEFNAIPIVAVTAHSSMKDREKCLLAGMNDYISKPININFLKMTIDQWLNEARVN